MKEYLEAGVIVNTHGINGCVMITSMCDTPAVLAGIKTLYLEKNGEFSPLVIDHAAPHKGMVLAKPIGVDTPEQARLLRNRTVYARREDIALGEGAHFVADLIGLPVINETSGRQYGVLADVLTNAANDVYEIETPDGMRYMPAVSEFVLRIDTEKGIFVLPIEGMFDEI